MKTLTVFTPTYNRAYTLHKCYESLQKQTSKDFIWLIIDDGSTDNTKELVDGWIAESKMEIRYKYQENQGMHGAHNTAYELIDTELNVCIDSDDYMPEDAVENIVNFWKENKRDDLAGIAGLDIYESGEIIGEKLPEYIKESTYWDIYHKYRVKGDKKLVYRSDLTRKYPYPVFEGEKYVGLGYKYAKLDDGYKLLFLNKPLCVVEYMEDGSTRNMLRQYRNNPRGFAFIRVEDMQNPRGNLKFKFKSCVHYVSSNLISKNKKFIKESPCKLLTVLAFPLGFGLYKYIMRNS